MTVEQAILENVKVLSPDQQQEVLAFIKFLQSHKWENIYKGRFKELQKKIRQNTEIDPDDDPTETVLEGIQQGFHEAITGQTLPLSQLWN
ncbi:hypothetical protein [Microcoleus sp. AT3-D2]|uniref:hypothetical protein n=1 Tax=Microcoleus sp. AT3-D2 TaxID=2818612 RepID=UPI002FD57439